MVEAGELLLALYGATSGDIAISKIKGAINQAILCIRTKQNKKFIESVWNKHVERLLQTYLQGGQGNLSADIVKNIPFYFTSCAEQDKLAQFVSLLDERIATQNKIIEDLKKLKSAIVEKLFADRKGEYVKLGNISSITNGNGDVQDARTDYHEWLFPFFDRSEEQKFFDTYSFDKEAIIYAGEGQSFMPRYYNGKFALHQRCYAITDFADIIVPQYCYHYMKTLNSYFIRNAVGSTVPSLRIDTFQKAPILLLEKETQYKICDCLNCLDNIYNTEMRLLLVLMQQKQYLLQSMFI